MFIMHIALQGCLRARHVDYGITPDTGGHIRYLLELVGALEADGAATRQEIVVRRFDDAGLGPDYAEPVSALSSGCRIVRLSGSHGRYVAKEDMADELPALADALEAHVRALDRRPDVIHAHYADAGALADEMRVRLCVPYLFTAHSLGRSKPGDGRDVRLRRRVRLEERAVAGAERVVASSIDEAELQYRSYRGAHPEKIRVNPPGCDLAAFGPSAAFVADGPALESVRRGLDDPDRPVVLALARPVARKNLGALVRAYASSERLRETANLVVFAGNQGLDETSDPEARAVLAELHALVARHGLEGRAVLPARHATEEVPGIYRFAADRRGVFVNCALSEPFGLTLLEAAASGLPVVATRHGGPSDIVGRAGNGRLVEPTCTASIAAAVESLIDDPRAWADASARGLDAATRYTWARHARAYAADVGALLEPPLEPSSRPSPRPSSASAAAPGRTELLVCDIDETLTGCATGLGKLRRWLARHPDTGFAIATGRSLHSALDVIAEWGIPAPSVLITSVGAEIYRARGGSLARLEPDPEWPDLIGRTWPRRAIVDALGALEWLEPQGPREQREHKLAYFLDGPARVGEIRAALDVAGLAAELIASHGRFLDVLPVGVSKGHAIAHLADGLGIPMARVHAAGDSGNDLHMLNMVGRPIVVGNCSDGLPELVTHPDAYFATAHHAGGVLEGLTRRAAAGPSRRALGRASTRRSRRTSTNAA